MTEDDKALVAQIRKEASIQIGFDGFAYQTLTRWADRIEALSVENERLQRSAEYWEQDAKRYAANQEYWRMEERAAIVAYLRIKRGAMQHIADDLANVIEAGEHLKCTASPEA